MAKQSQNAVKAGGASVTIGADDSPFYKAINAVQQRLKAFAATVKSIGANAFSSFLGNLSSSAMSSALGSLRSLTMGFMDVASTAGSMASKIGLSASDVQAAMSMKAAWIEVYQALFKVKNALGAALAPAFTAVFKAIAPMLHSLAEWIKQNEGLVRVVGLAIAGLVGLAGAVVALGVVLAGVVLTGLAVALVGLWKVLEKFMNSMAGLGSSLVKTFREIVKYVNWLATGIADALMGGDAMLAIEIFWKGFQLAGLKAVRTVADAFKKALGSFYVNLGGQSLLGITDAQLKAREQELQDLINKAKNLPANAQNAAGAIPKVLANSPIAANARFSAGAASTIARAYNAQQSIPLKQVMLLQKIYAQLQKNGNVKPVKVKQVKGP